MPRFQHFRPEPALPVLALFEFSGHGEFEYFHGLASCDILGLLEEAIDEQGCSKEEIRQGGSVPERFGDEDTTPKHQRPKHELLARGSHQLASRRGRI